MMQSFYVGNFCDPSDHQQQPPLADTESHPNAGPALPIIQGFSSPLIDLERNLALFLGLFNHTLYKSIPLDHEDMKVNGY